MKVTDVKVHVVSVPLIPPEPWRFGRLWGLTSAVVEVDTDEGITGIGETLGSLLIKLVVEAIKANSSWLIGEGSAPRNPFAVRPPRAFVRASARCT